MPTENNDAVMTAAETAIMLGVSAFTLLRKRQRPMPTVCRSCSYPPTG
jgi:hypothetical protein